MFWHLRIRMGLAQRDIPETVTGKLRFADGSEKQFTGRPEDLPAHLIVPVFPSKPGIFLPSVRRKALRN
jgi:hypothetical protein